jgi:hypothetical protein
LLLALYQGSASAAPQTALDPLEIKYAAKPRKSSPQYSRNPAILSKRKVRGEATIKPRFKSRKERERSGPGFARLAQSKDPRLPLDLYQGSAFEPALSGVEGCHKLTSVF